MDSLTRQQPSPFGEHHQTSSVAALAVLFWVIAAALVIMSHRGFDSRSPVAATACSIGALLAISFVYTRLTGRAGGISLALGTGIAWLLLSILTEIFLAAHLGHGWFSLLGTPKFPLLRTLHLFAWIFAPAVFARGE